MYSMKGIMCVAASEEMLTRLPAVVGESCKLTFASAAHYSELYNYHL